MAGPIVCHRLFSEAAIHLIIDKFCMLKLIHLDVNLYFKVASLNLSCLKKGVLGQCYYRIPSSKLDLDLVHDRINVTLDIL